ncbi:MAG: hypothetical protein HUU08_16835 [Candidatus Brocadia sp.]|nr:hypothetical protein [Candidatus Brocadia sp.]
MKKLLIFILHKSHCYSWDTDGQTRTSGDFDINRKQLRWWWGWLTPHLPR